jgi:predicted DsbA family dithiol-disulfide isomerase
VERWLTFSEGVDKTQYYRNKFGDERTTQIFSLLSQAGAARGIAFKFGGKTGNTRNAHRLIHLGKTHSPHLQTRVVEELFSDYFENERDITDVKVLQEAGVRAGLDEQEVKTWLESDKGGREVDEGVQRARQRFISGVPNFTLQGKYEIGGAQEEDVFLKVWETIKREENSKV